MPSTYSSFSKEDIKLFMRVIKPMYVESIFLNRNRELFWHIMPCFRDVTGQYYATVMDQCRCDIYNRNSI